MKQALVHISIIHFFLLDRDREEIQTAGKRNEEKKDEFSSEAHHAPVLCSNGRGILVAHATG